MINLKNKNYHKILPDDIFIDRTSPLGNPYSHKHGTRAEFVVATVDEAIECYRTWLNEQIANKNRQVCDALNQIYKRHITGNVSLVCHCIPRPCHGNVIKAVIEAKEKEHASFAHKN